MQELKQLKMASPDTTQMTSRVLKPNTYYIPDYIMNQITTVIRKSNKRDMGVRHINTKNYFQDGNLGELLVIHYMERNPETNDYYVIGEDFISPFTTISEIEDIVMRIDLWTMRRVQA